MGLNKCKYHVEVYMWYTELRLYQEHAAVILVIVEATAVPLLIPTPSINTADSKAIL